MIPTHEYEKRLIAYRRAMHAGQRPSDPLIATRSTKAGMFRRWSHLVAALIFALVTFGFFALLALMARALIVGGL